MGMFDNKKKPEVDEEVVFDEGSNDALLIKVRRFLITIICLMVIIVAVFDVAYQVDVAHSAVVTTLGRPETINQPGFHFKLPIVQTVEMVDTTIKGMSIGYNRETNETIPEESVMITSDYNFIDVDFYLEYQVSDPVKYVYNSNDATGILKAVAQNCIRSAIASYPVDIVLTTGKNEIQSNIKSMLTEKINALDIGISVKSVTIQDAEPPTEMVSEAFKAVETAKQNKETQINEANKYRNEQIPAAEAEVDSIVQQAEAAKAQRIADAEGQVAKFNAMYAEYVKYPEVTKKRMFYETMEETLPYMKVVINGSNGKTSTVLPLDSFVWDKGTAGSYDEASGDEE